MKNIIRISLLLTALLYSSCKEEDFLDGSNRDELFAEPTQIELDAIWSDWKSRDLSIKNYKVEQETKITNTNATLKIVSFTVSGHAEYGALVIPESDSKLPVRLYVGGFGINNNVNSIKLVLDNVADEPFVFAFPALRGQSLSITINDIEYTSTVSEGDHCDAFDGASDDVIAFLNVIEETVVNADVNRATIRGGSRGATVSLLVAERDKRIKGAVGVAGPVNLLELTSSNENDKTYQCQFLSDLIQGSASVQSVRKRMIASSPLYFVESLPKTQLHLGKDDRIVPVSQGVDLKSVMTKMGNANSLELFIYDGRTHDNIATENQPLNDRINEFLRQF